MIAPRAASKRKTEPGLWADRDRVLFVHVPRTGGQAIRHALGLWDPELHLPVQVQLDRRARLGMPGPTYAFTVVRNPFDRLVSIFAFLRRSRPDWVTPAEFQAWVRADMPHPDTWQLPVLYAGKPYAIRLTAPQTAWLQGMEPQLHRILRFEHLEADFRGLCQDLGVSDATPLEHHNGVPRELPPPAFYDGETYDRVARLYREDVKLVGVKGPTG